MHNQVVALNNLVNMIVMRKNFPVAENQTFLVSYYEGHSKANLLRRMGATLGRPMRLFYRLPYLFKIRSQSAITLGICQHLFSSLQLDFSKCRRLLGWRPQASVDESLRLRCKGIEHEALV